MNRTAAISRQRRSAIHSLISRGCPTLAEAALAVASAFLTILSFPNFDLWFLAWIGLAPLLLAIARAPSALRASVLGWLYGTVFFYGTCWWLTYPMIHYAHISAWLAYPLFLLPVMLVALFPALFCGVLTRLIQRYGTAAICVAPLIWISIEWLRYAVTGQLWNALGYSQAFHPMLIQSARWGGVYAVSFLLLGINSGLTLLLIKRFRLVAIVVAPILLVTISVSLRALELSPSWSNREAIIIAVQPNVPMDLNGDPKQMSDLVNRHLSLSASALNELNQRDKTISSLPRLVIWPESPMNFSYSSDPKLRETVGNFARTNQTSVLLNSLEPAPGGGDQNSAVLVNQAGVIAARYDKIRLMPFGEYVPLPRWLPGASSVRGLVGEFKPGDSFTLMPLGAFRAGVFICIEAAHPAIARTFTQGGADVLINISNDGYLGPTAVMRQHLSNAIFRAVENDRHLIRVTNTGISASISSKGSVWEQTAGFQPEVRTWMIAGGEDENTFYSRRGDVFVYACALISLGIVSASFMRQKPERKRGR